MEGRFEKGVSIAIRYTGSNYVDMAAFKKTMAEFNFDTEYINDDIKHKIEVSVRERVYEFDCEHKENKLVVNLSSLKEVENDTRLKSLNWRDLFKQGKNDGYIRGYSKNFLRYTVGRMKIAKKVKGIGSYDNI